MAAGKDRRRRARVASLMAITLITAVTSAPGAGVARAHHYSDGCAGGRRIALTFDDGPNPPATTAILDILRAHGAVATFFDAGQAVDAAPQLAQREAAAGMSVGLHSHGHAPDLSTALPAAFAADLRRGEQALAAALGARTAIYRAPFGRTSDVMLEELRRAGYDSIGWDVDSTDWRGDATAAGITRAVLDGAHPGAIVLLHDGALGGGDQTRAATIAALPAIIEGLRAQGYELATVPEITGSPAAIGAARGTACSAS